MHPSPPEQSIQITITTCFYSKKSIYHTAHKTVLQTSQVFYHRSQNSGKVSGKNK